MRGLTLRGPQFTHVVKGVSRERRLRVLGLLRIALGLAPALSATGTRVLPGGAQKGAKEIAEGFPRQEVRHVVDTRAVLFLENPFLLQPGTGPQVHAVLGGSSESSRRN